MTDMVPMLLIGGLALVVGILVLVVIFLLDRFSGLERDTQALLRDLEKAKAKPAGPFAGLSGKKLWDALTGLPPPELDEDTLDSVRMRYRAILAQHITYVFQSGVSDGPKGFDSPPSSSRNVQIPKGKVESWLPAAAVAEIYRCGQAYSRNDPAELPAVRQALDTVHAQLHEQCGLDVLQSASSALMSQPLAADGGTAAAGATPPAQAPAAPVAVTGPVAVAELPGPTAG